MFLLLALQEFGGEGGGGGGVVAAIFGLIYLAVIVLMIASMWKIFDKAGQPAGPPSVRSTTSSCFYRSWVAQCGGSSSC